MSRGATGALHYPALPDGTYRCAAFREGAVRELAHLVTHGSDPDNPKRAWLGIIRALEDAPPRLRLADGPCAFRVELVQPLLQEDVKRLAPKAWELGCRAALTASRDVSDDDLGPSLSNDEADLIAHDVAKDTARGLVLAGQLAREATSVFTTAFGIWMAHALSDRVALLGAGAVESLP